MSFQNPSKTNDNAAETTTSGPSNFEISGQESMDAFTKMQHKFDSLMGKSVLSTNVWFFTDMVTQEEEKFAQIEQRHKYEMRMLPLVQNRESESNTNKTEFSPSAHLLNKGFNDRTNNNFDDVTSIRTDSYKMSAREHNLLDNHFNSNY